jgi:hypothetical protein
MKLSEGVVSQLSFIKSSDIKINDRKGAGHTEAIVGFTVNSINYKVKSRALGIPKWHMGKKVGVYYLPEDPNISRINRWDELYFYTLICAHFLTAILLISFVNFIVYKVRGRPLS